jgi:hypothetical protein
MGFGLIVGFIRHTRVATNKYDSLSELHIPKIIVTIVHIKFYILH